MSTQLLFLDEQASKDLASTMCHSRALLTPAEALLRVYAPTYLPRTTRRSFTRRSQGPVNSSAYPEGQAVYRPNFQAQPPSRRPRIPKNKKLAPYKLDNEIRAEYVQLPHEDGKLGPQKLLRDLLNEIEDEQVIQELAPQGQYPNTAVVRITTRDELLEEVARKEQAVKALQKQSRQAKPKQLELNWAISENDLLMKIKQMTDFLDQGRKVELLLAAKKRQRRASPEEGAAVLSRLREKFEEVGAKEIKDMQGKVLGQVVLTVQKVK